MDYRRLKEQAARAQAGAVEAAARAVKEKEDRIKAEKAQVSRLM
jgi:hypothetical protein